MDDLRKGGPVVNVTNNADEMSGSGALGEPSPTYRERWKRIVATYGEREHFLMGASVFRLIAGFTVLIQYLLNYAQRRYLFGPDGVYPFDTFVEHLSNNTLNFSIYAWSRSTIYFEICYHLGILVATLWALGYRTRILTPIQFVFWWSFQHRFSGLWDGGDNLMRIVLIYAMFANLSAYFSLDARSRAAKEQASPPGTGLRASAMLHNAAMLAIAFQLCLLYGIAGLSKVQGETWRNGTALYYAMRGGQYVWPGFSELIYHNSTLIVILSYATVAFQVSFPFLIFMNKYTRRLAIGMSLLFHVGIMLFMGLITFSCFMMSVDLALVEDDEYAAIKNWFSRVRTKIGLIGGRRATS
jgi:antimicrobial peptide system SdpB family protein